MKILFLGESGTGKTGALASLAEGGYKLRILDFDNGLQPLIEYASPEARTRIVYETLKDKYQFLGNIMKADNPTAASKAMMLLDNWKDSETGQSLGSPYQWDKDTIVVIDSLSLFGQAALAFVLKKNAQAVPRIQDWGEAMNLLKGCIATMTSPSFAPHVIINTHITFLQNEEGVDYKGLPQSLGKTLNEEIPKYFNIVLGASRKGTAKIHTQPSGFVDYKFPKAGVKPEYPLATGLREIFKFLRGKEPVVNPAAQQKV